LRRSRPTRLRAQWLLLPILLLAAIPAHAGSKRPLPELFNRTYTEKVAEFCAAKGTDRAQSAYGIAWMLLKAQQKEKAAGWLHKAAALGHERARVLLGRLPASGRAAVGCGGSGGDRPFEPIEPPQHTAAMVRRIAPAYDVDPDLALAVIAVESGFRADAVSPKNAQGLMQLIPDTAQELRVIDSFDPVQNVHGGVRYLAWLLRAFDGDLSLALAGYNAGPNAVRKHDGIPPYAETQRYVSSVRMQYAWLKRLAAKNAKAAE
jgi:hypothetical protein